MGAPNGFADRASCAAISVLTRILLSSATKQGGISLLLVLLDRYSTIINTHRTIDFADFALPPNRQPHQLLVLALYLDKLELFLGSGQVRVSTDNKISKRVHVAHQQMKYTV